MKRRLPWLLIFLLAGGWIFVKWNDQEKVIPLEKLKTPAVEAIPPPIIPALLPARAGTSEKPLESWERILAADGTPAEDRAALADVVTNYLQSVNASQRPPLGTNEEITRALTDPAALGDIAIPTRHPAILSGQLMDRWGSPWFFHQTSASTFEVRSAGPDRKIYTADDIPP